MTSPASEIKEQMPVKDVHGKHVGTIESTQGIYLKLGKDDQGRNHWISTAMVDHVDDEVHLNVDEKEMKEVWTTEDPGRPENIADA